MAASQEIPALKETGGELALPPGRENGVRPQQPGESEVRNQDHTGEDLTIQGKGLAAHSPTMPGTQLGKGISHLWPIPWPPRGQKNLTGSWGSN